MKSIFKKISYSVSANILSAFSSVIIILVLPRVMSMEDYGFWQLFMFYFSYVGFFHFGWIDGIYLRYGGQYYEELNKSVFSGQLLLLLLFLMSESMLLNIMLFCGLIKDLNLLYIIRVVSIAGIFANIVTFCNFLLQMTDRIREYARNVVFERFLNIFLIVCFTFLSLVNYRQIVYIQLIVSILMSIFGLYVIRDIVLEKPCAFKNAIQEAGVNISVGSKLMLSNIAGMLILGIIRYGISRGWDVVTFGKVSLSLQISNFLMVFISAVSVVLFPILKRTNEERLADIYTILRRILSYSLLGLLISYYPIRLVLVNWLPKYIDSLIYMGYLLPICIFESKMQMLVNTYLKSLRQEVMMLKINALSVCFAMITTYYSIVVLHDLKLVIICILLNFAFRLFISECYIEKILKIDLQAERYSELIVVMCFVGINYMEIRHAFFLYLIIYSLYIAANKKNVTSIMNKFREKV